MKRVGFDVLYETLIQPEHHIGLRKGLIPIYLAVVLHEYKRQVIILDGYGQVPTSADVLIQVNSNPEAFSLSYLDWDPEKETLSSVFRKHFRSTLLKQRKEQTLMIMS